MTTPLSISCPSCGSGLKIKDYSLIGKKVPCPKCKVPFQIAVSAEAAPVEVTEEPHEADLWEETRLWRCPWCSKESQILADEPDPSCCDECRANAPRPKPSPRNQTTASQPPKKGGLNRKNTLLIGFGSFVLLFFACCLLPMPKKEDRNKSSEVKATNKLGAEAGHQTGGFQQDPINVICAYLEEDGHRTNPYKLNYGDAYYACSNYKDISPNSLNHIAYYVDGTRTKVSAINLDLSVADVSGASAANRELLASGEKLVQKATGNPLPNAAREAILAGGSGTWQIGPATVRLTRIDYVIESLTGRGYSLNLRIEWK